MRSLLFAAVALFVSLLPAGAQSPVTIIEPEIQSFLKGHSTLVRIPVRSQMDHEVGATLTLSWVNREDTILQASQTEVRIQAGQNRLEVPLPLPASSIWLRLRYSLSPRTQDARAFPPQSGIVGIARIANHVFELKASQTGALHPGSTVLFHAQAVHPVTRQPLEDLDWSAVLALGQRTQAPARVEKQGRGFMEFAFNLPSTLPEDGDHTANVSITAKNGDFLQETNLKFEVPVEPSATIQTDKPIYQPGQTLHIRAILLDPRGHVASGVKASLRVEDGDGQRAHTAQLTASRFGIIQDDWTLPETAPLGAYSIELKFGNDERVVAQHAIRVSRYELPKFQVTVKPDRTAYLPGQTPVVAINGSFLFGNPVPRGHVKVVRASDGDWRMSARELRGDSPVAAEGDAAEDGTFQAKLDVQETFDELRQGEQTRYRDVAFAAYYTDPASHRTEQRRFDIRLTRERIHIYVLQGLDAGPLPRRVYVTTSYADGRPAVTTVEASLAGAAYTTRTNRYGVARLLLPSGDAGTGEIEWKARDAGGVEGKWTSDFQPMGGISARLTIARTLYQPGDPVEILIETPDGGQATPSVQVHALVDNRVVASRVVSITVNQGRVTFPYQREFHGIVTFAAWTGSSRSKDEPGYGAGAGQRSVIFPQGSDLRLTVQPGQPVYKPGEQAALKMRVQTADGHPVEAALGLAVVDQAVLERARTDSEFGQRKWFDCVYCPSGDSGEIGGIQLSDLLSAKPAQSRDPELNLVAEALLSGISTQPLRTASEDISETPQFGSIRSLVQWMEKSFTSRYAVTFEFPTDETSLAQTLGPDWYAKRDPWNRPYLTEFGFHENNRTILLKSTGPDQLPGTDDDFVAGKFQRSYFLPLHRILEGILHRRQDFPADEAGVRRLLSSHGLLVDTLHDPWGTPYLIQVETVQRNRNVYVYSAGPDRVFHTGDDFRADSLYGSYFLKEEAELRRVIQSAPTPPRTLQEFNKVLADGGIELSRYSDAWGHPYRLESRMSTEYGDRVSTHTVQIYGGNQQTRTSVTPVTRKFIVFVLRSSGPDGKPETSDDFEILSFPILLQEESSVPAKETQASPPVRLRGSGEIAGTVLDPSGAAIPLVEVGLTTPQGLAYITISDPSGAYSFPALPDGTYVIQAATRGFMTNVIEAIPVRSGKVTQLDITLQVGAISESLAVQGQGVMLQTESASLSRAAVSQGPASTPRIRTYFPETLYWVPELTTNPQGLATTRFPLADSITTWKVAAIASTLDGRQVETEADLRVFQPFFLDFDPPLVLTQGDEVRVPVAVRNYLDRALSVDVALQPNDWSAARSRTRLQLTIPANTTDNQSFEIVAKTSRRKAAQRITAQGGELSDAIERTTDVHPDGQAATHVLGDLVAGKTAFYVTIPATAIAGATTSELRLYPNILTVLSESAAALLITPHGCAEQTTSAGFANLIALRYARTAGLATPEFETRALKNIRLAVDQLVSFRAAGGGISYWGSGDGDASVTAYVLDFLLAAKPDVEPDEDDIEDLVHWLESTQSPDGRWNKGLSGGAASERRLTLTTAQVARSLAAAKRAGIQLKPTTLAGAYHHLARFTDSTDEPYMLAQFILAALDSGNESLLGKAVERLSALAFPENTALYWDLQANSPFYGWGIAGRAETTGLVITALTAWRTLHPQTSGIDTAIRRGLLFLLRHRDPLGSWYSTQSTVRAMRAVADASAMLGPISQAGGSIGIRVNGRLVHTVKLPSERKVTDPVLVDMSSFLGNGENQVELAPLDGSGNALLRMTTTHWIPWTKTKPRSSPELRLSVGYDRLESRAGQPIRCTVKAERVGFRGYGMMLAEIGLPPGAEVDRSSLEELLDDDTTALQRYEILPDRVVFYLWPRAGGASLTFQLSGRLAMTAKAAASTLYDYYNPEALSEVEPATFKVR